MRVLVPVLCLLLAGCVSAPNSGGVRWYNPSTWFSGSASREVAKVDAKIDRASDKALGEAQKAAHATQDALALAPNSRQVDVAKANNDNAVALLDQLSGPLSAADVASIRERIRLLTSDLAEERARGEAMQKDAQTKINSISKQLDDLTEAKKKADSSLLAAFQRENALANELRNERWWSWFWRIAIGSLAVLLGVAWLYVRLTIGGLPTALSRSLANLRATEPALAEKLTSTLDVHLSPAEQSMIRLLTAKLHP